MSQIAKTTPPNASIIESVITAGDLAKLSPGERTAYYNAVCESIGLNPLTKPFEFINLNGKLTMYACKSCTDQLRQIKGVSIGKPDIKIEKEFIVVAVEARDASGRTDSDIGVVNRNDMRGDMANVLMKAVTKAKRRVTLSICGLGMLDETEVESIVGAAPPPKQSPAQALWGRINRIASVSDASDVENDLIDATDHGTIDKEVSDKMFAAIKRMSGESLAKHAGGK